MNDSQKKSLAERALAAAEHALAKRFDGAAYAFVSGSIMRGQGTRTSDIDLVVVFPTLERAWREAFIEGEFPVEAFVQDPQTLAHYLHADAETGRPIMAHMVATGTVIGPQLALAEAIQAKAARLLADGPAPFAGPKAESLLYFVSDLVEDLRDERPPAETAAAAASLYPILADLMLFGRGAWSGRGKWVPRLLRQLDGDLADAFDNAFRLAVEGDAERLVALAESELARHGGPLFDGYRQEAPLEARRTS